LSWNKGNVFVVGHALPHHAISTSVIVQNQLARRNGGASTKSKNWNRTLIIVQTNELPNKIGIKGTLIIGSIIAKIVPIR
jgi:hypothetical protein